MKILLSTHVLSIDGAGNNRIMTIRPFSTHKSFFQEEYRDIKDWFENGIQ
jgi:hypothetical protein